MHNMQKHGVDLTWLAEGTTYRSPRTVLGCPAKSPAGLVCFDVPLCDSIDASLKSNGRVIKYRLPAARTQRSGLENFLVKLLTDQSGSALSNEKVFPQFAVFRSHSEGSSQIATVFAVSDCFQICGHDGCEQSHIFLDAKNLTGCSSDGLVAFYSSLRSKRKPDGSALST